MLSLLIKVLRKEQAEERGENGAVSVAPRHGQQCEETAKESTSLGS